MSTARVGQNTQHSFRLFAVRPFVFVDLHSFERAIGKKDAHGQEDEEQRGISVFCWKYFLSMTFVCRVYAKFASIELPTVWLVFSFWCVVCLWPFFFLPFLTFSLSGRDHHTMCFSPLVPCSCSNCFVLSCLLGFFFSS